MSDPFPHKFQNTKKCPRCGAEINPKLIDCPNCLGIPDPTIRPPRAKSHPRVKREPEPGFEFDKSIPVK